MCCYESESKMCFKTTISTVNSLHIFWILDATFTLSWACKHGWHSEAVSPNFVVHRKVCFKRIP